MDNFNNMKVEFQLILEDVVQLNQYVSEGKSSQRKTVILIRIFFSFIFFMGILNAVFVSHNISLAIYFFLIWLTFLIAFPYFLRRVQINSIKNAYQNGKNPMFSKQIMEFTQSGFTVDNAVTKTTSQWNSIQRMEKNKYAAYFFTSNIQAYIIPIRAFKDEADFNIFFQTTKEYYNQSKTL